MNAAGAPDGTNRRLEAPGSAVWGWTAALGGSGAVALVYFLAARLGLALLSAHSDIAVFLPASGIAAGILIVLGRRAVPALVIGVVVGTVAGNLMSDRTIWTSTLKGFCSARQQFADLRACSPVTWDHFRQGLRDLGYVDGRNIVIDYRSAQGDFDQLRQAARELASMQVNVISCTAQPRRALPGKSRRQFQLL